MSRFIPNINSGSKNNLSLNNFYSTGSFKVTEETPIYYYGGHGSDVCDSKTHIPIIKKVPEDCLYITITECGTQSTLQFGEEDTEENLFRFEKNLDILRHPNYLHYKRQIARELNVRFSAVHVHLPGDDYVLSYLSPFSFWSDQNHSALAISGLIDVFSLMKKEKTTKRARPFQIFSKKKIVGSIRGSSLLKIIDQLFSSKITRNHGRILLARMKYPIRKSIESYFYTEYQANRILADLSFSISKATLLSYFECSIFPTKEYVKKILDQYVPYKTIFFGDDLPLIAETLDKAISPYSQENDRSVLSNENMMDMFPGIHYNVVCRVVPPDCKIGLQRSMSTSAEQVRMGFILEPERNSEGYEEIHESILGIVNDVSYANLFEKRQAVFTALEGMANEVIKLPDTEKKKLLELLLYFGIVEDDNKENDFSKVIKYFVYPEKYKYVRGSTRKQTGGKRGKTRKYRR